MANCKSCGVYGLPHADGCPWTGWLPGDGDKPPAPKPDPRDARIAELERTLENAKTLWARSIEQVSEEQTERMKALDERDQAQAECERLREALSEHPVTTSSSCSESAKSEQERP